MQLRLFSDAPRLLSISTTSVVPNIAATIGIVDLEREPFIVMKEGHCLGDQVLRFCDRRGTLCSTGIPIAFRSQAPAKNRRRLVQTAPARPRHAGIFENCTVHTKLN